MQLLVSVANGREARAALQGGADVIDAKDPRRGGRGRVTSLAVAAIRAAVPHPHPVSVALGDAYAEHAIAHAARSAARHSVAFLKVGFAGVAGAARAHRLATAARAGAGERTALVLVAYADWRRAASLEPERVLAVAAAAGARGVLLDTAFKEVPLFTLVSPEVVGGLFASVHAAGLFAALAGGLGGADFATVQALEADLVGVRGAACVGGRTGRVSRARVAALRRVAGASSPVLVGALG